jgi:hypothetical protein
MAQPRPVGGQIPSTGRWRGERASSTAPAALLRPISTRPHPFPRARPPAAHQRPLLDLDAPHQRGAGAPLGIRNQHLAPRPQLAQVRGAPPRRRHVRMHLQHSA